eukprot:TRINITY_DN2161_c2_g1_i2.p1 TRINITY_DN2161_c2_g1~~TRINITY_DN2161_c2_g1_i2.p1  ORF type:complete len:363 (+),score=83.31 TRINITY_DN2161_c2_g1_i2:137-1090(+)
MSVLLTKLLHRYGSDEIEKILFISLATTDEFEVVNMSIYPLTTDTEVTKGYRYRVTYAEKPEAGGIEFAKRFYMDKNCVFSTTVESIPHDENLMDIVVSNAHGYSEDDMNYIWNERINLGVIKTISPKQLNSNTDSCVHDDSYATNVAFGQIDLIDTFIDTILTEAWTINLVKMMVNKILPSMHYSRTYGQIMTATENSLLIANCWDPMIRKQSFCKQVPFQVRFVIEIVSFSIFENKKRHVFGVSEEGDVDLSLENAFFISNDDYNVLTKQLWKYTELGGGWYENNQEDGIDGILFAVPLKDDDSSAVIIGGSYGI